MTKATRLLASYSSLEAPMSLAKQGLHISKPTARKPSTTAEHGNQFDCLGTKPDLPSFPYAWPRRESVGSWRSCFG